MRTSCLWGDMALQDIGRSEVIRAVKEFDRLGLEGMIKRYGGHRSRRYFLEHNGKRYDQKLIARVAHEFLFPERRILKPHGDGANATRTRLHLEGLGFKIIDCTDN